MREIKFRIWEKQIYRSRSEGGTQALNRYYEFGNKTLDGIGYDYDLSPITGQVICHIDYDKAYSEYEEQPTGALWNATNDVVLEQYTGLKDRHGNDLYEGDVCWLADNEIFGEVIWDEGAWCYHWGNIVENLHDCADSLELRGNVYENPELLK